MTYSTLTTNELGQTGMISLHHLAARGAALMNDRDAVVLERVLQELLSRAQELDMKKSGRWTDRETARKSSLLDKEMEFPS